MSPTVTAVVLTCWLFAVGACVGSFLNVCVYRLPAGLSIVWPPSHCTKCLKRIAWYDNIPVVSYFVLRGRCRNCGERFSIQYAAVEALTGAVFAGFYLAYFVLLRRGPEFTQGEPWQQWAVYLTHVALASALIVSSAIDFKYKEIYTTVTNVGMVLAVGLSVLVPQLQSQSLAPQWFAGARLNAGVSSVLGLVVGGGLIWVTRVLGHLVFRREAMGFGDVLLMGMIGAALGWESAVLVFFIAPFFGLAYGVWGLIRRSEREVPYGPFLSMATAVVMLFQGDMVAWFRPGIGAVLRGFAGG